MLTGTIREFVLAICRVAGKPHVPIGVIGGMATVVQTASLVFVLVTCHAINIANNRKGKEGD